MQLTPEIKTLYELEKSKQTLKKHGLSSIALEKKIDDEKLKVKAKQNVDKNIK